MALNPEFEEQGESEFKFENSVLSSLSLRSTRGVQATEVGRRHFERATSRNSAYLPFHPGLP
jgi:hypothetical protein